MKISCALLLLLAACGEQPEAFTPVSVDIPVAVTCSAPVIPPPQDFLASLSKDAGLAAGMKACLEQSLSGEVYAAQLSAALDACR